MPSALFPVSILGNALAFFFNNRIDSLCSLGAPSEDTTPSGWMSAQCPQVTWSKEKLLTISLVVVHAQVHPKDGGGPIPQQNACVFGCQNRRKIQNDWRASRAGL